jgi:hypothetical protein
MEHANVGNNSLTYLACARIEPAKADSIAEHELDRQLRREYSLIL